MADAETLTAYLTAAQLIFVVLSVGYLARQVRGERIAQGFQAYSYVTDAYMRHLWLSSEHNELNCIWEPLDDARRTELEEAQSLRNWGAWHEMSDDEKRCYRYTRAALEIFEQAWEVKRRKMIGDDTWSKWEQWLLIWCGTRYFRYVYEDSRPRLLVAFCSTVEEIALRSESDGLRASYP
jgi:hypothetical protein